MNNTSFLLVLRTRFLSKSAPVMCGHGKPAADPLRSGA
jgi:hypothetical protein